MNWTLAQAKRDFSIGYLTEFSVSRSPMVEGWHVRLKGGTAQGFLVDAHDKEPRTFKTLDAAVRTLETMGFQVIALEVFRG